MKKSVLDIFSWLLLFSLIFTAVSATPNGASVIPGQSDRPSSGASTSQDAVAGNITALTIYAGGVGSQTWQGYHGNVSGGLTLSDSSNNVLYNWSLITPAGEVYASTNSTITWSNIQCFNYTANGNYTDESGRGGTTNMYGTNITILESEYGISPTDMDGINETFNSNNHDLFYSSSHEFSENECNSLQLFSGGSATDGVFEEMLLYEPTSRSVIFASILEDSITGFRGSQVDFQMIVPEDGHAGDTSTTQYYFFMEIE